MIRTIFQWTLPLVALFITGPALGLWMATLRAPDGGPETSFLVSASLPTGLIALIGCLAVAAVSGALCAFLADRTTGFRVAALCLAWPAMRAGDLSVMYITNENFLPTLALEGLILALLGILIISLCRASGGTSLKGLSALIDPWKRALTDPSGLATAAVVVAVGLAVSYVIALTGLRGQALAAGIVGPIFGAMAGMFAGSFIKDEPPQAAAFLGALLLCVAGPVFTMIIPGAAELPAAARAGTLPGPALVQPIDWLVGALLGTPIGLGWAGSMIEKGEEAAGHVANARSNTKPSGNTPAA